MTARGSRKSDEQKYFSRPEVSALLYAARERTRDFPAYYMIALQYLLGLRIGEVLQLRYDHLGPLDTSGRVVYVNVPTLKKKSAARAARPICPFTDKPLYPVPVLSHASLVAHAFDRKSHAEHERTSPWLFPSRSASGKRPLTRSQAFRRFHAVREAAGLPDYYTPHALRHSSATALYERCRRNRVVSVFLRHSDGTRDEDGAAVTHRYVHFSPAVWQEYRGALDLPPLQPLPPGGLPR